MQFYSDPRRESAPYALPDCEVFYADNLIDDCGEPLGPGYYYQFCFPGCMPDSEPYGPFTTQQAAIDDAQGRTLDDCL